MTSLSDAWRWYEAVRRQATMARRLAAIHWDELPWDCGFGRDAHFRDVVPEWVVSEARFVADELADLAVLVLFSVFEATVRDAVFAEVRPEAERVRHPALRHAAEEALDWIAEGSFFRVLEPFKSEGQADLVEQVNQVRRYRNWVAHGRRGQPPANVTPEVARDRLERFLSLLKPNDPGLTSRPGGGA